MTDPQLQAVIFSIATLQELSLRVRKEPATWGMHVANTADFYEWASLTQACLENTFGGDSTHAMMFKAELDAIQQNCAVWEKFLAMQGLLAGAKAAVEGGFVGNLRRKVASEIFNDILHAAKTAADADRLIPAAVLSCGALENILRRLAVAKGLIVADDQGMEQTINALKSARVIRGGAFFL